MKILLCTQTFNTLTHGPSIFANILLKINQQYPDIELRVLTEDIAEEIPQQVYKVNTNYPRPVHAIGIFLRMFSYHKAALKIKKHYDYDLVLYNNAIVGLWSALRMSKNVKVAGIIHDDDYLSSRWSSFNFTKLKLIFLIHKPFEYLATQYMDMVIANSDYIKKYIEKEYKIKSSKKKKLFTDQVQRIIGILKIPIILRRLKLSSSLKKEKVKKLYMSIETKHIPYCKHEAIDEKNIKVLFVKSDYVRGGLELLVKALEKLKEYSFTLTVVGPLFSRQKHIQSFFKKETNVLLEMKGALPQSVVFSLMAQHDMLCIPSLREGLGMANMEGLIAGIPVVSTQIGGIPEVLNNGRNGWLAAKTTPQDLANSIQACITSPTERQIKSEQGRRFVQEHFNTNKMLKDFVQHITESLIIK